MRNNISRLVLLSFNFTEQKKAYFDVAMSSLFNISMLNLFQLLQHLWFVISITTWTNSTESVQVIPTMWLFTYAVSFSTKNISFSQTVVAAQGRRNCDSLTALELSIDCLHQLGSWHHINKVQFLEFLSLWLPTTSSKDSWPRNVKNFF